MINKNNYEAYILDYLEGTISEPDKQLLLLFLEEHPELKDDLEVDISLSLKEANDLPSFQFKEELLKHEALEYDLPVKDYLQIKQLEEGLSKTEQAELILTEPDQAKREEEKKRYAQLKLRQDDSIFFGGKNRLRRFVFIPALRQHIVQRSIAIAASVVVLFSLWIGLDRPDTPQPNLVNNTHNQIETTSQPIIAQSKILEKVLPNDTKPSKDSLLKLSNNPMAQPVKPVDSTANIKTTEMSQQYLATIGQIKNMEHKPINAYEYGLNVMMPQYMNNNLLRAELASIYKQIEEKDESASLSLALVESGVKVMNFLSKDQVEMSKYYNADGKVVGYQLKGENIEVNRRVK